MTEFFALPADQQSARLQVLAQNALAHWGQDAKIIRLIKYRENAVFEVRLPGDVKAALRVHRQGYHSDDSLQSELQWMAMLATNGLVVPEPVLTSRDMKLVGAEADGVPGIWQVDVLSWLDGQELGAVGEPLEFNDRDPAHLFFNIGSTAGLLHKLTTAWLLQNSMKRHAWDTDGLVGDEPLWGQFWQLKDLSARQKELFLEAKSAIANDLKEYGMTPDNFGLIHADMVPENVMLSDGSVQLIDFDDAGFGWHMFELVTAIYWLDEEPLFETLKHALFEGYRSVRTLQQRDLDTFDLFMAARSLTYLGWVHTRSQTESAVELTPVMIDRAENYCAAYMDKSA